MKRCDKQSADPDDHTGPFNFLHTTADKDFAIEGCRGCGNTVIRRISLADRAKYANKKPAKHGGP